MFSLVQNLGAILRAQESRGLPSQLPKKRDENIDGRSGRERDEAFDARQVSHYEISTQALIQFLEDYLETRLGGGAVQGVQADEDFKPWLRGAPSNSNRSPQSPGKVAGIYQKNAHEFSVSDDFEPSQSSDSDCRSENKNIYFLIQDLRILRERGVKVLGISENVSFLDGIFDAVEDVKHHINIP